LIVARRDYYKMLGVGRDAKQVAIKRAYRRLVLKYHPDRNKAPRAAARFLEIQEAYAVLSDPEKRLTYDRAQPDLAPRSGGTRGRAEAPRATGATTRRLFHLVVEGLGLSLGASVETRSVSAPVGPRRSARRGTAPRRTARRNRRPNGA
jgi:DnaJ-class molecular chaperone